MSTVVRDVHPLGAITAGRHGPMVKSLSERVAPAEAGEAAEFGVVGVDFGLVFDGRGGDVGVGDEVGSNVGGGER